MNGNNKIENRENLRCATPVECPEDSDTRDIMVLAQRRADGAVHPVTLELIRKAQELCAATGGRLVAVCIGEKYPIESLKKAALDEILWVCSPETYYLPDYAPVVLCDCIRRTHPTAVLVGATAEGKIIAAQTAVLLGTGISADSVELYLDGKGRVVQSRPAFNGNLIADVMTVRGSPQIITIKPGVFQAADTNCGGKAIVSRIEARPYSGRIAVVNRKIQPAEDSFSKSNIIVAIGQGVRSAEDIPRFKKFAESIGAELGASRALVSKGWMPQERQIGLTGTVVSPKLLITLGISGSVQFRAGLGNIEKIIAVNTDRNAPIFQIADIIVPMDLYAVVEQLQSNFQ